MKQFSIQRQEAARFATIWNHKGVAIVIQDVHIDFATDFANVVLRNFIQMCQQQAANQVPKPVQENTLITEA